MTCPQPQSLSERVSGNAVPTIYGDTWGQLKNKFFIYIRISKKSLYSRARVGTDSPEVSPLVPTLMGTGAFDHCTQVLSEPWRITGDGDLEI